MLIDTHAHLQWASFDKDRENVINRARKADVKYIVNIGFDLEGCKKAIELAGNHSVFLGQDVATSLADVSVFWWASHLWFTTALHAFNWFFDCLFKRIEKRGG